MNTIKSLLTILSLSLVFTACNNKEPEVSMVQSAPRHMSVSYAKPTPQVFNDTKYAHIEENSFKQTLSSPLSTFSIDVDTASYTSIKNIIENENVVPPAGSIRIEEMINYFNYDYETVKENAQHPITVTTELMNAPWNEKNKLMLIGLQAKKIDKSKLPSSNFVALIDTSGSMTDELELVKKSLKLLAKNLDKNDRLSIVTYDETIGITLKPTPCDKFDTISSAVDTLKTYGGTNGEAGIEVAYEIARETFIPKGNNRIIMFTDGDFNVGKTSNAAIVKIVKEELKSEIYLSLIGYGSRYNDSMMEEMSKHGNGNYNYVSDVLDAKKVFDKELMGTLYTLGKDVKLQVEFNPNQVSGYRLIGYENRMLESEDFNNDKKDAGEIGVGHTVTALYELVLDTNGTKSPSVDSLKYQKTSLSQEALSNELATVKMRYKKIDSDTSSLYVKKVEATEKATNNIKFASSVAGFGMLLRESKYIEQFSYTDVLKQAKEAKGLDENGYRAGFIDLVQTIELVK